MVYSRWEDQLKSVTLKLTLLLAVACVDVEAIKPGSRGGMRLHSAVLPPLTNDSTSDNPTRLSFQQASGAAATRGLAQPNPWTLDPGLSAFMKRFDIPAVHGSGIRVDLGSEQDGHREPSGICPVFGKIIKLYQPSNYPNDFLQNAPTSNPSQRPLPGGFNNPQIYSNMKRLSPIDDATLRQKLGSTGPQTAIGRCAKYAYATVSVNPKTHKASPYKYPFVVDQQTNLCYVLAISAQELKGDKYCSTNGRPSGLTWYCFEPRRDETGRDRYVYGSAYIGKASGDEFASRCPVNAVRDALFGVWKGDHCERFDETNSVENRRDLTNLQCWSLVFENQRVASDQREIPSSTQSGWDDFWPKYAQGGLKSGGVGVNWANYYIERDGVPVCSLFGTVPNCFVRQNGATAYTALGGFTDTPLPVCSGVLETGECVDCRRQVRKCQDNKIITITENCCDEGIVTPPAPAPAPPTEEIPPVKPAPEEKPTPEPELKPGPGEEAIPLPDQGVTPAPGGEANPTPEKEEESGGVSGIAIAGGIIGGLFVLGLAGAAGVYYKGQSTPAPAEPVEQPAVGGKEAHRASDVAASTDMSFWGETDESGGLRPMDEPLETNF